MSKGMLLLLVSWWILSSDVLAQKQEVAQLLLNVEKLAQFKEVLQQMKQGYQVLSEGYQAVNSLTKGNFSLHATFLDGLLGVSPAVKKYRGVTEILHGQIALVKEVKKSLALLQRRDLFSASELRYMDQQFNRLIQQSFRTLEDLATILRPGSLRMDDAERMQAIDGLWEQQRDRQAFLKHFLDHAKLLAQQRLGEQRAIEQLNRLY